MKQSTSRAGPSLWTPALGTVALWGSWLVPLSLFFLEAWPFHEPFDDAYISYRYALNLIEGHGLVFNVGERVEGYTNPLWTLLIATGLRLGFDGPAVTHVLGLASGVLLLIASHLHAARLLPASARWLSVAAPLAILASSSFAAWTPSGLETPLFAALVTLALVAHAAGRIGWACFLCVVATLTRPEGALVAALLLGPDWFQRLTGERLARARGLLSVSAPCLAFAAYLVAHTLFRLVYYGDVVPNTFHAKVGGVGIERGLGYLHAFLVDGGVFLLLPALAGCWWVREVRVAFAVFVAMALYAIAIGGDVFPFGRFLLPALPALVTSAVVGSHALFVRDRRWGLLVGLGIPGFVVCSLFGVWPASQDYTFVPAPREPSLLAKRSAVRSLAVFGDRKLFRMRIDAIRRLRPPVKTLAIVAIGEVGYRLPDVTIVDLVGLTDRHIASSSKRVENALALPGHLRTDADYVLDREPDVLWIPRAGSGNPLALPCVLDLWSHPRLAREYFWDEHLEVYRRKLH